MHLAHSQLRVTAQCKIVVTYLSVGNTSLSIPFFFHLYHPSHQQPSLSFPLSVYSLLFLSRQQVIDPQSHLSILESGYSKLDLWSTGGRPGMVLICADVPAAWLAGLFNAHPPNKDKRHTMTIMVITAIFSCLYLNVVLSATHTMFTYLI